jgi:outer membrane receptor protein involved in Fe transport
MGHSAKRDLLQRCSGLALLLAAAPALAQQAPPSDQLQEVVVTASKRSATVQETPISVTAVSAQDIADRGITDFNALAASTPGVSLKSSGPGQTEFEMRGLSSSGGNSPTVGFYLDDAPLTPPSAAQNGKVVIDPTLYDLNRVEVLRGPQGTLYGSSSMGGTIKLITNRPDPSGFDAGGESILSGTDGGGFNHNENVMLNVPFADGTAALRIVGSEAYTSGWIDRIQPLLGDFPLNTNNNLTRGNVAGVPVAVDYSGVNDEELLGTRVSLLWKPTDRLTITPSIFYQRTTQGGPNSFDSNPGEAAHYEVYDLPEPFSDRFIEWSVNLQYKFDDFDVTSTTAKWNRQEVNNQDESENLQAPFGFPSYYPPNGVGPALITESDYSKQLSQELRITSSGDSAFKWLVGSFYSSFESDYDLNSVVPGLIPFGLTSTLIRQIQPTRITQTAGFGEMSYQFTDTLKLTTGLRWYSYQSQLDTAISGVVSPTGGDPYYYVRGTEADEGFNPKFDLSYQPTSDLLVYTSATKGFRPGGGNQAVPTNNTTLGQQCLADLEALGRTTAPVQFGPDSVWSYEIGEKARLLDNRVTVNGDFYYENWTGVQQQVSLACGFPFNDNAGKARIYGTELEIKAILVPGLVLTASGGYTDAALTQNVQETGSVVGDRLQDVPPWTGSLQLAYTTDLTDDIAFTTRVENDYVGTRRDATYNQRNHLPAYDLTNLRLGLTTDSWSGFLFANNLFNKRASLADVGSLSLNLPTYNRIATNQPLTIGLDLSYSFAHPTVSPAAPDTVPEPPLAAPKALPPVPELQRSFQVFFDFDKAEITEAGAQVIKAASDAIKAGHVVQITVVGHTDTVGTPRYNQALSERRAATVKQGLVADGIAADEIATKGVGKAGLLVPTSDGVREPQNRRAEINLG